jgi:hypothetical protein
MFLNRRNKLALLIRNGNSRPNQKFKIIKLLKTKLYANKETIKTSNKITDLIGTKIDLIKIKIDLIKTKVALAISRERIEIK